MLVGSSSPTLGRQASCSRSLGRVIRLAYFTIDVNPPRQPCDLSPSIPRGKYLFVTGITPALSDSQPQADLRIGG